MVAESSSSSFFMGGAGAGDDGRNLIQQFSSTPASLVPHPIQMKKKRNQPGNPHPDAEVIALSPRTLVATNRFICEVCNKGFQREQNLQLHRRGHNLPWKLKKKTTKDLRKKVYLCPEPTCVHHDPSRALGDLTGIKKHFFRKHGEKRWRCEKCTKKYAVHSDWKAHSKTCGTKEYKCDCGTIFARRDSFITHRAFCDALAQESTRIPTNLTAIGKHLYGLNNNHGMSSQVATGHMLRLGNLPGRSKFEHFLNPANDNVSVQESSLPLFMQGINPNHMFQNEQHHQQLHGQMQIQELNNNNNNNLINLGFFPNTDSSISTMTTSNENGNLGFLHPNQFNLGFHENIGSPPMSATGLLNQASQMGSAPNNYHSNLLRELISSSSSLSSTRAKPYSFKFPGEGDNDYSDSNNNIQGIMNSLVNGSSANIYGGGQVDEHHNGYVGFNDSYGNVVSEDKLQPTLISGIGGSNKMTLDFLGVEGMTRNDAGADTLLQREVKPNRITFGSTEQGRPRTK